MNKIDKEDARKRLWKLLSCYPHIKHREMQEILGLCSQTVTNTLSALDAMGIIKRNPHQRPCYVVKVPFESASHPPHFLNCRRLWELLSRRPDFRQGEMQEILGLSLQDVDSALESLAAGGYINRYKNRFPCYTVNIPFVTVKKSSESPWQETRAHTR